MTYALTTKDGVEIAIYKTRSNAMGVIKAYPNKGYKVRKKNRPRKLSTSKVL